MSRVSLRDVEDLFAGTPVELDEAEIRRMIGGQTVLVTGAAGSIGSELCRQLATVSPRAIVGFDIAESALFYLDREMKAWFPETGFIPAVGSVQNRARVDELFRAHRPSMVYHAAAYKHVPMMESHVIEAVENNVLGTWEAACAAREHGADFVLISSDKAVYPASVMGASKRIAEMIVAALGSASSRFLSVRFGNVVGSNGSVIPVFLDQIENGGPLTVTHECMERYFMTVADASRLVIQASVIARGGEIFVLDMGRPVKIMELAHRLIAMSGIEAGCDIQIEIVGTRPGEKLREELTMADERAVPTKHPRIKAIRYQNSYDAIATSVGELRELCKRRDAEGLMEQIKSMVPSYQSARAERADEKTAIEL